MKVFIVHAHAEPGSFNGAMFQTAQDTLRAAGHAVTISDLIIAHCYAPLFINVSPGGSQWTPDLIGFDALHSYGGVSYHVLKLFGNNHGNEIVTAESANMPTREVPMRGPGISSTDPRMRTVPRFYYDAGHRDGQDLREGRQSDARSVAGSFEDFRRVECRADGSDWRGEGKRSFGPEHYH